MSDRHSYGKPEEGDDSGKDRLLLFLRFFAVTNGKFCAGYQVLRQEAAAEGGAEGGGDTHKLAAGGGPVEPGKDDQRGILVFQYDDKY